MVIKEKIHPGNEIKIWLMRHGLNQADINRKLGYSLSGGSVCHLLRGVRYPKRIVEYLETIGCPAQLLSELKECYLEYRKSLKKIKKGAS